MNYAYKFQDDDPKGHSEYLTLFNRLKENKLQFKDMDKARSRGIGILSLKLEDSVNNREYYEETISYIMNPLVFDLASNIKNLFFEKSDDVNFLLYHDTLTATRSYRVETKNTRSGFMNLGKIVDSTQAMTERYVEFRQEKLPKFNFETFGSNQIVHPLDYADLEQIMHYMKESK